MSGERNVTAERGSFRDYLIGFISAVVLTAIPFVFVMTSSLPRTVTLVLAILFAAVQIAVHLVFFLRLNGSPGQRWNLIVFIYTLIILALLVGASIWILYRLDYFHMGG